MSSQLSILDVIERDVCASRHRGSPESEDAHKRVIGTKQEMYQKIMTLARAREEFGITVHEVAYAFGKTPNEVSGRLSELVHKLKWLRKSGERRNHAAILVEAKR